MDEGTGRFELRETLVEDVLHRNLLLLENASCGHHHSEVWAAKQLHIRLISLVNTTEEGADLSFELSQGASIKRGSMCMTGLPGLPCSMSWQSKYVDTNMGAYNVRIIEITYPDYSVEFTFNGGYYVANSHLVDVSIRQNVSPEQVQLQ